MIYSRKKTGERLSAKLFEKSEESAMKKRALSVFLALCMLLTLVPVTAGADSSEVMQPGIEMKKSWSSAQEDCVFTAEITQPGFYNLTVRDYKCTGKVGVEFYSPEHEELYYQYYASHDFSKSSGSDRYTYKNVYLDKGTVELHCAYWDEEENINLDATVGLTLELNEGYCPVEIGSGETTITRGTNEIAYFSFRTDDAGDYIIKSGEGNDCFLLFLERSTLDESAFINRFGQHKSYRLNLKANTEYLVACSPQSDSAAETVKIGVSRADKDISNITLSFRDVSFYSGSNEYEIEENAKYCVTYSDGSERTFSYQQLAQADEFFDFYIEYTGEYNYTKPDEPLLCAGEQSVKLYYLNKQSSATINVMTFWQRYDDALIWQEYDIMSVSYKDNNYHEAGFLLSPSKSGYYQMVSSDGWDTDLELYELAIFDRNDNYVQWDGSHFYLEAGRDYCVRFGYMFASDELEEFNFWMAPQPDTPTVKLTTSGGHPKLSWNKVDGAVCYYIYRSTNGKDYKYLTYTTKTSYTNTKTTIGTTYYYKVMAVDAYGTASELSKAKKIKCVPATPTVSISRSSGKAKLSWKAVDGATKYYIYRSTDGKNFEYRTYTTKLNYTDSKSASGTKYYYKVRAVAVVNGTNVGSAYSAAKSIMTTLAKPTVKIATSNGKPKLTWSKVTGADKYYIYSSTDGKKFSYLTSTTKLSLTNTSAKKNTKYYYKVKAVCSSSTNANSAYSTVVSIKATK